MHRLKGEGSGCGRMRKMERTFVLRLFFSLAFEMICLVQFEGGGAMMAWCKV